LGLHEANLLSSCVQSTLPALQFIGVSSVENYHCNVFQWAEGAGVLPHQQNIKRLDMLNRLIALEPEKLVVEQFTRSRPMLGQRLNDKMIDRLCLVATGNSQLLAQLDTLKCNFDNLRARLGALPLQILNPDIKPATLLVTNVGELILTHWGRWCIEPIGAGWPVKELGMLHQVLISAQEHRSTLIGVSVADVRMAALMFSFENFYNRQQYVNALDMIPTILASMEINIMDSGNCSDQNNLINTIG